MCTCDLNSPNTSILKLLIKNSALDIRPLSIQSQYSLDYYTIVLMVVIDTHKITGFRIYLQLILLFLRCFFIGDAGVDECQRFGFTKIVWNDVIRYILVAHPSGHHIKRDVQN